MGQLVERCARAWMACHQTQVLGRPHTQRPVSPLGRTPGLKSQAVEPTRKLLLDDAYSAPKQSSLHPQVDRLHSRIPPGEQNDPPARLPASYFARTPKLPPPLASALHPKRCRWHHHHDQIYMQTNISASNPQYKFDVEKGSNGLIIDKLKRKYASLHYS